MAFSTKALAILTFASAIGFGALVVLSEMYLSAGNGLLDGRALLSADVVGDGQAVVQGSLTVHVPQQRLCQSAIATEGNLDTLAGLKVACVLKSDDDMKGSPDEIERLEPGTHVQATLPFLVIPRAF
jgi:hypothetical protein